MFDAEFCFAGLMLTFDLVCACCQQSILGNENRLRVYRDVREILTYKHAAMLCKPTVPWKGTTLLFWEQRWTWVQIYGHSPTQPTSPTTWLKLKICTYTKVNKYFINRYCQSLLSNPAYCIQPPPPETLTEPVQYIPHSCRQPRPSVSYRVTDGRKVSLWLRWAGCHIERPSCHSSKDREFLRSSLPEWKWAAGGWHDKCLVLS